MENNEKIVLVIGGSRGIGAGIVWRLAAKGFVVYFTYTKGKVAAEELETLVSANGRKAYSLQADATDQNAMKGIRDHLVKSFGKIDAIVNNAGVFETGTLGELQKDSAVLDRMWEVNVLSMVRNMDAFTGDISEGGRIVLIGSGAADRVGSGGVGDYAAGKAALAAYTRAWARDLANRNITVNIVQPGLIQTDLVPKDREVVQKMSQPIPLKRLGTPDEIGNVVAFLVSEEASYVTGAIINVDGGLG
ncbi:SDR family NAD(P)-dependent oxidoreductase [Chryseobacterium tongliaoense]|uniref:SDR family NAD(P)-dependent oxidoreductase n=1 Tax=Chryseobacterium tongliaoense TaxID=3240933 RepID=UPI00351406A8